MRTIAPHAAREFPPVVYSMAQVFAAWGAGLDGMSVAPDKARGSGHPLHIPTRPGQRLGGSRS